MSRPLSRRQLIRGAALAAVGLPTAARAAAAASAEPTPARGLDAIRPALSGVGLYVGNEWYDWDSPARRFALAKIRAWGFDFVCAKVGGYGRTTYRDEAELRGWADAARGVGLGFLPFLYTIPSTADADAGIAAQMARVTGIACVDMEDEWGTHTAGPAAAYQGAAMTAFGARFRAEAGSLPIIVTGYGDPITRFGSAATGFPHAELAAWADAYSPQWYVGAWSRYHQNGVEDALRWGQGECRAALGPDFPLCPSVSVESGYAPDGLLPLPDIIAMMAALRASSAPVIVWEYGLITPAQAEALLGPPMIRNVRIGRTEQNSFRVLWDTHIPARGTLTCQTDAAPIRTASVNTLELTQSAGLGDLTPGTSYPVTVQALTQGGVSPAVPLTVATAPATPGIFAQSAIAARSAPGQITVTLLIANSADTPAPDVRLTSLAADGAAVLAPPAFPLALGPLGPRDWQASMRDRAELTVVLDAPAVEAQPMVLHLMGANGGKSWAASLPVMAPALP